MIPRQVYYLKSAFRTLKYSPAELERFQFRLLKNIIEHAYVNFPFYRDMWESAGFSPEHFRSIEDLKRLPIISGDEFRSRMGRLKSSLKLRKGGSLTSSGSSHKRLLKVDYDDQAWDWLEAVYLRGLMLNGYKLRGKQSYYWYEKFERGLIKKFYVPKELIHKDLSLEEQLELLEELNNEYIVYFPMVLFTLAKKALRSSKNYAIKPKAIFTQGEILTPTMRSTIKKAFGGRVGVGGRVGIYDHYSSTEFNRIAWECPERKGYHLAVDSVYVEVLDDKGKPVGVGEPGQLVGTNLVNQAAPIIRYNLGDIVVPSKKGCHCNTNFPTIREIKGREIDIIYNNRGERIFPSSIIEVLARYPDLLMFRFRFIEEAGQYLIKYVPNTGFKDATLKEVRKKLQVELDIAPVEFEDVDDVGRTRGGKIVAVERSKYRDT